MRSSNTLGGFFIGIDPAAQLHVHLVERQTRLEELQATIKTKKDQITNLNGKISTLERERDKLKVEKDASVKEESLLKQQILEVQEGIQNLIKLCQQGSL